MKKIITILAITSLFSCENNSKPVIKDKVYVRSDYKLPSCICMYSYSGGGSYDWVTFQDSCDKYNLFDTLTGTPKNK